jgi:hypothetical protein
MRYAMLIFNDPNIIAEWGKLTPAEQEADMEIHREWFRRYSALIKGGEELQGPEHARIIRKRGARVIATDGPFAEAREFLGGFVLLDAPDLAAAEAAAAEWRGVERWNARIDLRPLVSEET